VAFPENHITFRRGLSFAIAGAAAILVILNIIGSLWIYLIGAAALFLGVTDFGRRCPLVLSIRYLYARRRKRTTLDES
jgi:hypothetical protein